MPVDLQTRSWSPPTLLAKLTRFFLRLIPPALCLKDSYRTTPMPRVNANYNHHCGVKACKGHILGPGAGCSKGCSAYVKCESAFGCDNMVQRSGICPACFAKGSAFSFEWNYSFLCWIMLFLEKAKQRAQNSVTTAKKPTRRASKSEKAKWIVRRTRTGTRIGSTTEKALGVSATVIITIKSRNNNTHCDKLCCRSCWPGMENNQIRKGHFACEEYVTTD